MTGPLSRIASAAAATACLLAAPHGAFAQTPDPVEQALVRFGPFGVNPSLLITNAGVDNNVFNDPANPKQDFTFTLTPRAEVLFRARRLHVAYTTSTDYVYYQKYSTERGTNQASSARVDFDAGRLRPFALVTGTNSRDRLNTEVDARARHHDLSYGAGFSLRLASRTSVTLNARRSTQRFDPGTEFRAVPLDVSFNSRTDAADVGVALELTPLTTLSLIVGTERQRFDLSQERDSDTLRITPTLTFSPLGLLQGTAAVGYRRFSARSPLLRDFSGLVASGSLTAAIRGRHQAQGAFFRDIRYSYDQNTPYYLGTGGTITWTTQVAGPWDVRGTGGRERMDYRNAAGAAGNDTTYRYGGGVGFRILHRARLGINGEWSRRISDRSADRDYRNHRVFGTLTWGKAP